MKLYRSVFKRFIDLVLSVIALVALFPVLLIISILVRVKLGTPVFFVQNRPGRDEKIFRLYKFRTMSNQTDENGQLLPDHERLTAFGRRLRSLSLDELPELINIIKGDMSIVGPRPLAVQYLPFYNEEERKRHTVLPGLTGLAQVHGRNATTWEERLAYDVEYTKKISLRLDAHIIYETIKVVLKREGIGERGIDSLRDFDEYRQSQMLGEKNGNNRQ